MGDYDALADLLESIGHFLSRLEIYTEIPPTDAMNDMIVKILVELLSTLALATKEIKRGRFSESVVGEGTSSLSIIQLKYHSPSSPSFHVLSQQEMPIQCSESCSARTNHLMVLWTGPDGWNS